MSGNIKKLFFTLAVIAVIVTVASAFFIAFQTNHCCIGHGCEVCCRIAIIKDFSVSFKTVIISIMLMSVLCFGMQIAFSNTYAVFFTTPVFLKDKLLN